MTIGVDGIQPKWPHRSLKNIIIHRYHTIQIDYQMSNFPDLGMSDVSTSPKLSAGFCFHVISHSHHVTCYSISQSVSSRLLGMSTCQFFCLILKLWGTVLTALCAHVTKNTCDPPKIVSKPWSWPKQFWSLPTGKNENLFRHCDLCFSVYRRVWRSFALSMTLFRFVHDTIYVVNSIYSVYSIMLQIYVVKVYYVNKLIIFRL